MITRFSCGT